MRFDDCVLPDWEIGRGRTLASIQHADLFGANYGEGVARLVAAVLHTLARRSEGAASPGTRSGSATVGGGLGPAGTNAAAPRNEQAEAKPTVTSRWRLTHTFADAPAMSQLGNQGFDHRAYLRSAEQTPPWVRVRAVVACDLLGEIPRWQELRREFSDLLARESIGALISELAFIPDGARWRPRATQRRSWLEADLTGADEAVVPAASAILFLPEPDPLAGVQPGCAQLTVHIDLAASAPVSSPRQTSFPLPYWRARLAHALAVPGDLASWLENQLGLMTSNQPPAQFGIMLQARQPLTEIIDTGGIQKLQASYVLNQFTGWAVADATGKAVPELVSEMMLDLSERILHLDGTLEQMSGLV